MQNRRLSFIIAGLALVLCVAGCTRQKKRAAPIAEAYAGPISINLREEITPGSKTVAAVKHGEKLDVLQTRRRFVRVRTPSGAEGWTDLRQLLTPAQMDELRDLSRKSAKLPSQGAATVFGTLNIHTEPSRYSPSFYQITEGDMVDVLAHRLTQRVSSQQLPKLDIKKPAPRARKKKKEPAVPPPPKGAPPALPANWLELSKTTPPPPTPQQRAAEELKLRKAAAAKPVRIPVDDWSLVRTPDGKAGWVLSRMLVMAIPDEVAQYSEGARITSYFSLGKVYEEDGSQKNHWLWTTIRDGLQPYEFDSFRVFIYTTRRHRYETAYIERKIKGYYPVEVHPGPTPSFSLIVEEEDGQVYRKTYAFEGYLVRMTAKVPAERPPDVESIEPEEPEQPEQELASNQGEGSSFGDRVKSWTQKILR